MGREEEEGTQAQRGSLELETWLSLMKTTLDTFGRH